MASRLTIADIPKKLVEELVSMDQELTPGTWADGYTYAALRTRYSDFQIEAANRLVINPMKKEIRARETETAIRKKWLAKLDPPKKKPTERDELDLRARRRSRQLKRALA